MLRTDDQLTYSIIYAQYMYSRFFQLQRFDRVLTTTHFVFALLKLLVRSIRFQIILRLIAQNNIHLDCALIIHSTKSSNHRRLECFLNYILLLLNFTCLSIFSGGSRGGGSLGALAPLIFRPNWRLPPPPYLKLWILH